MIGCEVEYVNVKFGNNYWTYDYDAGSATSDTCLRSDGCKGISHATFCPPSSGSPSGSNGSDPSPTPPNDPSPSEPSPSPPNSEPSGNGEGNSGNNSCYNGSCVATSGSNLSALISGNDSECDGGTKIEDSFSPVYPDTSITHTWYNSITQTSCTILLENIE